MRFSPKIKTDIDELEKLISKGESVQLDFKQTISDQRKIARTIAAFANNKGGKLLIGVKDNGLVIGCDSEEEMYMIHEAAEHYCEPPVDVYFSIYELEDEVMVLEVDIRNSLRKPHFAMDDSGDWQLYMRNNDKTMVASKSTKKMLESEDDEVLDLENLDSKEQFVLDYLKNKEVIMAKELGNRLNISLQRANKILIKLMKLGAILQHIDARGEYYTIR
jgi:predicted HTH transcriptional regulator